MFHRKFRVTLAAGVLAWIAGFTSMAYGQSAPPIPTAEQFTTLLVLLALLMMNSPAATAGGGPLPNHAAGVAHDDHAAFLLRVWHWMQSLLENGPCIDPNGRCTQGGTVPISQPDNGMCIDPDGRCAPGGTSTTHQPDNGMCIDPNGRCGASS